MILIARLVLNSLRTSEKPGSMSLRRAGLIAYIARPDHPVEAETNYERIVCLKQLLKPNRIVNLLFLYDTVQPLLNFVVESHHSELRLVDTRISLWSNVNVHFVSK